MELETFYDSPDHGEEAKTMVAAILSSIKNNEAFDYLLFNLRRHDGWADPCCLTIEVARQISISYQDLETSTLGSPDPSLVPRAASFRETLSSRLEEKNTLKTPNISVQQSERNTRSIPRPSPSLISCVSHVLSTHLRICWTSEI